MFDAFYIGHIAVWVCNCCHFTFVDTIFFFTTKVVFDGYFWYFHRIELQMALVDSSFSRFQTMTQQSQTGWLSKSPPGSSPLFLFKHGQRNFCMLLYN